MTRFSVIVALVALGACSMRTHYVRPDMNIQATYAHADDSAQASVDRWWESFHDSNLNVLIEEALQHNPDLALAALNIRAAQIQAHIAVINPAVAAGYTYDYSKPLNGGGPATQFHSLTASVSYELDLWGQLAALKDGARWEASATQQDRQSAALALIGTSVNLYFKIASLNQRIASGEESTAYAKRILQLMHALKDAGGATQLEIIVAEQNLQTQKVSQADLMEQRAELRSALTVLLSGTPWPEDSERLTVPEGPPHVAAGLPALVLERRPDLRAAEMRLREALAQTDAMRLSFYPNLSLTGSVGTASTGLSEIVSNPLGSLAATISAPFVQVNQVRFATALARTQYDKAVLSLRKTWLQALTDVDNALSARTQLEEEGAQLERSLESAKTAERLYEIRYRTGAVALRSWLDAQESRRQAELALADTRLARIQNYAALCQALGGGADHL